ncbi:hypothetical protein BJ878DRAFT_538608 [Calycina marina]|uniref:MARVEL domain-containing protein n=1 Tax=Calycina marina TaxID=1763456 RepID=A0A9P7ZAB9_9HELO|nr:hypothetical protein BJ878DRAFT_538608 [Calycina marina]
MALKRNKRGGRPSPYPRIPFHALRAGQLLSSIVVSGIMGYFMYYLRKEHYSVPWTFIVLMSVSLGTVGILALTIILYNFTYLSPRFNLVLNGAITFFWALGLALLSWGVSTSHVLHRQCSGQEWGGVTRAGVCRDYKALWSMTLVGTVSTFGAVLLDAHIYRKTNRQGKYLMPEDDKDAQRLKDMKSTRVRSEGYAAPLEENASDGSVFDSGIGYHNRYGVNENQEVYGSSPLGGLMNHKSPQPTPDMGYHGQFFRD